MIQVFASFPFRQNLLVSVLVKTHTIPESWKAYDLQEGLQNYLVVIEMVFFAIAHYFVFSHKPYIDPAAAQVPCIATCLRMLDVRDVADDVREHFVDPLPRPRFRTGRGGGVSFGSTIDLEKGTAESSEESPLLKKGNKHMLASEAHLRNVVGDHDMLPGHVTPAQGISSGGNSGRLSDLSYDILTYQDMDSRTRYGLRSRMIANACREGDEGEEEEEEEEEGVGVGEGQGESNSTEILSPEDISPSTNEHNGVFNRLTGSPPKDD